MTRIYTAGNLPESPLAQAPKGWPLDVRLDQAAAWVAAGWATTIVPPDASPLALEHLGQPLLGVPVLRGPYIVDYTDIPHDGDTLTLWTPAVGDVLLRLFCDWQTVVQWNHGYLYVGQNPNPDYVIGSGSVSQKNVIVEGDLSHIATSGSGPFDNIYDSLDSNSADASGAAWFSSAYIFHSTVPVMIQLTRTGGTDPTAGHLAIYALVAQAVAP